MINRLLRHLFFLLVVRPVMLIIMGLNVRHRERLPARGPAILVANHNSHLDTMALICLFPQCLLAKLRPVAAADYFLKNRLLAWFSLRIIGILPLPREMKARGGEHPLAPIDAALARGEILIFYPEGTRGEPERLQAFKQGIAHIAERHADIPIVPIYLHGLGKALPKGEVFLVPFFCDLFIGEPLAWPGDRKTFMAALQDRITALAAEGNFPPWE